MARGKSRNNHALWPHMVEFESSAGLTIRFLGCALMAHALRGACQHSWRIGRVAKPRDERRCKT
eukprot:5932721-Prymnesium_polylepis.1